MDIGAFDATQTALLIADLQNDFVHPEGAYARGGQANADIAAVPERVAPVAATLRDKGGWIVSTHFTLVPGKAGEPFISPHLKAMRPFLKKGDFAQGGWGHALVDELQPADRQSRRSPIPRSTCRDWSGCYAKPASRRCSFAG